MSQHRPSHTHAGTLHAAATLQPPVGPADHAQGPSTAPVTLVEYGDYQCPYCGQAYPVVRALQRRLGDRLRSRARVDRAGTTRAHSMRNLLAFAIDVAGGLDRRNDFAALRGGVSIGGAIWDVKRKPGKLVDKGFDVRTHEQHVTVSSFSAVGGRRVFVTGRLVLERF